ncbi:MAG: DUF6538 domain-containing protein [Paracoccaceae bacterium]
MANYLLKRGDAYSVKVSIPIDVQSVFNKKAFKKSLKTTDKATAIGRSGPFIAHYKGLIQQARANPIAHLETTLRAAQSDPDVHPDTLYALQEEALDSLLKAQGVSYVDELSPSAAASTARSFKIATGQITPFDAELENYLDSKQVSPKTLSESRRVIIRFTSRIPTVNEVTRKTVRGYVSWLSAEQRLKNKTIRDHLSSLKLYWGYLMDHSIVSEDQVNPFTGVTLPAQNRKKAAAEVRLPFTVEDIKVLDAAVRSTGSAMLQATFQMAIFTGCRIEEIASLKTTHVNLASTSDDIPTLKVTNAKTDAGNRSIPIHDQLLSIIRRLLSEAAEANSEYLLHDLKADKFGARSAHVGREFSLLKDSLGFDRRKVFHSIRKTVATMFEQAEVAEGIAADILGHHKQTMSYGLYSGGSSLDQKHDAIMELDYS